MYMIIKYETKTFRPNETVYQYSDAGFKAAKDKIEDYQAKVKKLTKAEISAHFVYKYYKYNETTDSWVGLK